MRVQSKFENVASTILSGKGYPTFLPLYKTRRRWSDRSKEVEAPLFPGYFFCRFDMQASMPPIVTTPGLLGIVCAGRVPLPIGDDEIAAVQAVVRSGLPALPWPYLAAGARILIERGPLAGLEGIALQVDKKYRLVVSVTMLQRSVAVEIDRDWIRPLSAPVYPRHDTPAMRQVEPPALPSTSSASAGGHLSV